MVLQSSRYYLEAIRERYPRTSKKVKSKTPKTGQNYF